MAGAKITARSARCESERFRNDAPWHFVDASGETVILVGLKPGSHKVQFELADPTHKVVTSKSAKFTAPDPKTQRVTDSG
jgi:uncharacterized protein DUF6130